MVKLARITMYTALLAVAFFVGRAVGTHGYDKHEAFAWRIAYLDGAYDVFDTFNPTARPMVCAYLKRYDTQLSTENLQDYDSTHHIQTMTKDMREFCETESTPRYPDPGNNVFGSDGSSVQTN